MHDVIHSPQSATPHSSPASQHHPFTRPRKSRGEGVRSVLSTIGVLLVAPILAILLTAFVFQSYQVDGQSMETTLQHNDRLIVWKIPRTWARLTNHPYIPQRGDVVVFTEPQLAQYGQDPGKQLIKRVIGLPGDRVVIKNSIVTVYNEAFPNGFNPDESLPYGNVIGNTTHETDVTVKEGSVFVLGDNRNNSLDSRNFGPIETGNIVGKLILRLIPLDNMKRF